ncbi:MAG: dienelactone hydrolase family protein [Flavobacteriales bacterium]|nr:dienelactone hydrolase family protein [Flavobacteriales bacterium]
MKTIFTILSLFLIVELNAQTLDTLRYSVDGKPFMGFYAKPTKIDASTKTILIVHEWWGLNDYPKQRALQLAKDGFIAVCLDLYGAGIVVDNPKDAGALAGVVYSDATILSKRFDAGHQAALKITGVQKDKVAAIGYCFGGTVVLNAAKMGADLDAIVSFHGGLKGAPLQKGKLKASVLICNGAADKFVSSDEIEALKKEMKANKADFSFIDYADATHAFTNPFSTEVGKKFNIPIAYNQAADEKSWADFNSFVAKKVK